MDMLDDDPYGSTRTLISRIEVVYMLQRCSGSFQLFLVVVLQVLLGYWWWHSCWQRRFNAWFILKGTIVIMRTAHIRVHLRRIWIAILWHSWKHFKNNGTVSGLSRIGLVSIILLFSLSFQRPVCIHKAFHLNINTCLITSFSPAAHLSHDQLVYGSITYYPAHCY